MFKKVFVVAILLAVLNACIPALTVTSPTISVTQIILPTATLQPEFKTIPSPTLTTTPDSYEIKWQTTEQALNELKSIFPGMCNSNVLIILISPDETWLAQDCLFASLNVINIDGLTTWKVKYQDNQGAITPRHWTNDSHYLYFSIYYCCWDPGRSMLSTVRNLYRIDISNGEYNLIRTGLFDFSFSPTDRRLTFIDELVSPIIVEIQDLTTGKVNKVKLSVDDKYNQAKVGAWSSDGLRLAVTTVSGISHNPDVGYLDKFSVVIIDVNDLSQKFIVKEMQTNHLEILEWTENDIIIFQTGNELVAEPIVNWQYDLKTDTLITLTPTP